MYQLIQNKYLALAAALPLAAATSTNALQIDSFTTFQQVGNAPVVGVPGFSQVPAAEVLGGERDMDILILFDGSSSLAITATVESGSLKINNSPDNTGRVYVAYDGFDGTNLLSPSGLGGIDLTDATASDAFAFTIDFADGPYSYEMRVADMGFNYSTASGSLPTGITGGGDEVDFFVSFASFSGLADFTNIGAIELKLQAEASGADLSISDFRTQAVPEPASAALLALAGGLLMSRRRHT